MYSSLWMPVTTWRATASPSSMQKTISTKPSRSAVYLASASSRDSSGSISCSSVRTATLWMGTLSALSLL